MILLAVIACEEAVSLNSRCMRAVAEVIVRNEIVEGIVQLDPARIIAQVVVTDDHLIGKIIQIDRMR